MNKIKFMLTALALAALAIAGCEKDNQILNSASQESELTQANAGLDKTSSEQILYAITTSNRLLKFSSNRPGRILSERRVTGLQHGEMLLGIDFRPFNGKLYGLGSSSRLYVIETATGVATAVGGQPFSPGLQGKAFGFDFNPTVDRIRVVSNSGQNLRLHPDLGTVVDFDANTPGIQTDGPLAYTSTDANAGKAPIVVGAAYTNPDNDPNTGTTLYDLDAALDLLTIQNPPNNGTLNTVGALGLNFDKLVGFDIAPSGIAYATRQGAENLRLVSVNLVTGAVTLMGTIETRKAINGLAAPTL